MQGSERRVNLGLVPELPDVAVYVDKIAERTVGRELLGLRLASPFFLRTYDPKPDRLRGKKLLAVSRLAKRLVFEFEGELFAVLHLMVAGRFRWDDKTPGIPAKLPGKLGLAGFDFTSGTLIVTEASTKKRASLHLVEGRAALAAFDRGGLDVQRATLAEFAAAVRSERHTMKRTLTDQTLLSGIGNAFSDEILHAARLSPLQMSTSLTDEEMGRLFVATQGTLETWRALLAAQPGFPEKVTAFREGMAAHGRYGKPCPTCGAPIQRIVYADNETNYCATCQTGGKLLADRSMSRLLGADWPKNLEELENARPAAKLPANPERSTKVPKPAKAPRAPRVAKPKPES